MELYFRYPTAKDFHEVDFLSFQESVRLKSYGVLSKQSIEQTLLSKGVWTDENKSQVEQLKRQIRLLHPKKTLKLYAEEGNVIDWVLLEVLSGTRLYSFNEDELFIEDVTFPQPFHDLLNLTKFLD